MHGMDEKKIYENDDVPMKKGKHFLLVVSVIVVVVGLAFLLAMLVPKGEEKYESAITKKLEMNVGERINILDEIDDVANPALYSYSVSDEKIATVNKETGEIVAKDDGKVVVTIKSNNDKNYEKKVEINVTKGKTWIKYDKKNYSCKEGESFNVMINAGGPEIPTIESYSSKNEDIATIEIGTVDGALTNCTDCVAAHVTCKKAGKATLVASSSSNDTASATVTVTASTPTPTPDQPWIKYDKTSYSCKVGETFDVMIRTGGAQNSTIQSYNVENKELATIEIGTTSGSVTNCVDCVAAHVTCKKAGTTNLTAKSSNGATTKVKLAIASKEQTTPTTPEKGWIKFNASTYTCDVGSKFDVMITTGGASTPASVKSYTSSDPTIAKIEIGTVSGAVTNCSDCRAVHVTCNKKGSVTLTATSSTGAKATATVTVNEAPAVEDKGWIKYNATSYSCKVGESFNVMIRAGGASTPVSIKSFASSNTGVATIAAGRTDGVVTNCSDCMAAHVTCKKEGTTNLTAKSSTGVTTSVKVTVAGKAVAVQKVTINEQNLHMMVGDTEQLTTTVLPSNATNKNIIWTSADSSIVSVDANGKITAKKAGHTEIYAQPADGTNIMVWTTVVVYSSKGGVEFTSNNNSVSVCAGKYCYVGKYQCKVGDKFAVRIHAYGKKTTNGHETFASVASYSSANTSIATITAHPTIIVNCTDCFVTEVTCKKAGTTKLTAKNSFGATKSIDIEVTAK